MYNISKVISRDGKSIGKVTGGERHCQMDGCTGMRIGVRWNDGKLTFPCTKGMSIVKQGGKEVWKIE
jgi:hypothetical protein